ncbi:ABC transporter ATP-binding protein [Enterococcus nangangensis]|uniref:ABC transporter ATP-binding protein n=1 Tax=Enterococcus nangangensis TaxID=2559926 RepID=UPI0010F9BB48|nr:ATP-binding cassette domain-containing protein [Enterococcus nangangensis]
MENQRNIIVATQKLTKIFHGVEVLKDLNLSLNAGSIYGLLGRNGAGKTTLFKLLLGLTKPTQGEIILFSKSIRQETPEYLKKIGCLIETPVFYEELSAPANLRLHLQYMDFSHTEDNYIESLLQRVGLAGTANLPVKDFSLGMRQRLAIARAIAHQPQLLVLDEPINGLDPEGIRLMRELFLKLVHEEGMTILISSHILSEINQLADYIGILVEGRLVEELTTEELIKNHPEGLEEYFIHSVNEDGGNVK